MQPDYFDVLPLHPPPQPLESLTSYLTRLAETNGIPNLNRLQPMLSPDRHANSVYLMKDAPPKSLVSLSVAAFCPEATLQASTFYHLLEKFGRQTNWVAVAQFLQGQLAQHLRYCPLCLQNDPPHYILPWRFVILAGCPQHNCRLLDCCSCCGYKIPFLTAPLRMNRCPRCGLALSAGRVEPLDDLQLHQNQARYRDLAFLLSPPQKDTGLGAIGPRLIYWRKARLWTSATVADHLKIPLRTELALERRVPNRGVRFAEYLSYANYLGLTFEELFNTVLTPEEEFYGQCLSRGQRSQQRETQLIHQIPQAVTQVQEQDPPPTQKKVCRAMGVCCNSLQTYPKLRTILNQFIQDFQQETLVRKQQREQEWVEKVKQAIESLQTEGKPVTKAAICRLINWVQNDLYHHPKANAMMNAATEAYRQRAQQQEEKSLQEVIAKVQRAISELKSQGSPITKVAVAKMSGIAPRYIKHQPEIKMLFEQCAEWTGRWSRKKRQ